MFKMWQNYQFSCSVVSDSYVNELRDDCKCTQILNLISGGRKDSCCLLAKSYPTLCDPVDHQAPLFIGFSMQEYCSGLLFPFLGDFSNPGIEPVFPELAGRFFTTEPPGKPRKGRLVP